MAYIYLHFFDFNYSKCRHIYKSHGSVHGVPMSCGTKGRKLQGENFRWRTSGVVASMAVALRRANWFIASCLGATSISQRGNNNRRVLGEWDYRLNHNLPGLMDGDKKSMVNVGWMLVVEPTHLKKIYCQIGSFTQINNNWNHRPAINPSTHTQGTAKIETWS